MRDRGGGRGGRAGGGQGTKEAGGRAGAVSGGVLFFTSSVGLGHASRDAAVGAARGLEGARTRFVSGGGAGRLLAAHGMDVEEAYTMPDFDVRDGRLRGAGAWLWRYALHYRTSKKRAAALIRDRRPDLVVGDEDYAALAAAQDAGVRTVLITDVSEVRFGARGIGGILEREANRSMRRIAAGCGAVIVPKNGRGEGNVSYAGPIVRIPGRPRDALREAFGFAGPTVLACVGGTGAGGFLLEAVAGIAPALEAGGIRAVAAAGPRLGGKGAAGGVRDAGFVPNLHEMILAADLVVSLAGRSTMDECGAFGTPGVFLPIGGHFEQEDNAREEGFSRGDLGRLEELVRAGLARGRGAPGDLGGAERAAGTIRRILEGG